MPAILLTILALLALAPPLPPSPSPSPLPSLTPSPSAPPVSRKQRARERVQAVHAAIDAATDVPEWREELRRLCRRESWCNRFGVVGLHECDAQPRRGRNFWKGSVSRGKLRPETCAAHEMGDPVRWNTTGAFGQAATGVWMLDECVAPEAMYEPAVAAEVAVRTFERMCGKGWCSCVDHARVWAGVGRWQGWPELRKLKSTVGLCGARPAWLWLGAAVYDSLVWTPMELARGIAHVGMDLPWRPAKTAVPA